MRESWVSDRLLKPYVVAARPTCVVGIQVEGLLEEHRGKQATSLQRAGITGVQTTYKTFRSRANSRTLLVELSPWEVYGKLGIPLSEITNQSVGLDEFFPASRIAELIEAAEYSQDAPVGQHHGPWARFWETLPQREVGFPFVPAAARMMATNHQQSIRSLADCFGTSLSTLERGFRQCVGVSPKEFASLLRFAQSLALEQRISLADRALESGYYDQSHFIRDFRRRTGTTPKRWFAGQTKL